MRHDDQRDRSERNRRRVAAVCVQREWLTDTSITHGHSEIFEIFPKGDVTALDVSHVNNQPGLFPPTTNLV